MLPTPPNRDTASAPVKGKRCHLRRPLTGALAAWAAVVREQGGRVVTRLLPSDQLTVQPEDRHTAQTGPIPAMIITAFEGQLADSPHYEETPNGTPVCTAVVLINHRTKGSAARIGDI